MVAPFILLSPPLAFIFQVARSILSSMLLPERFPEQDSLSLKR